MTLTETKMALRNAVKSLKQNDLIKNDKDIITRTGYKKSAVSLYVNGAAPVSGDFVKKFEEVFKLNLKDYRVEGEKAEPRTGNSEDKYTLLLEKLLAEREAELTILRKGVQKITESLDTVLSNQITMDAASQAAHNWLLRRVSKDEAEYQAAMRSVDNAAAAIERATMKNDSRIEIGNDHMVR